MLVVSDNVVEATVRVNLCLHCNAILYILKLLVHDVHTLWLKIGWSSLLFLFVCACVVLIEVIAFNCFLQNLYYLLASVFFVRWDFLPWFYFLSWLKPLVVNHLVDLCQILLLSCRNPNNLLVPILTRLISEEDIDCTIVKDYDVLV